MRRNPIAGSAVVAALTVLFSYGVVGTEAIARATRGVINLPHMMRRTADDFQWRGSVRQGGTIEIKGINGDVTAMTGSGTDVEVTAERRARRNNPEEVRLEVVEYGDGVTICAVYPSKDATRPNECRPGSEGRMNVQNNDVSVRFVARLPPGVRFVGRTVNGDVDAQGLNGPVAISTVNGSTTFSTTSYGEASTVNGSIRGILGASGWSDGLAFHTVNGSITLDLPPDLSADVHATTVNGEISTDFPMLIKGRVSHRQVSGTIGNGGRRLDLETVNGSVRLRRR
nr:protein of unknown function (DUF4098) [uncultured bacterium]